MKTLIKISLFLLIPVFLINCNKESMNLNSELNLDYNQAAFVTVEGEKLEIKFIELVEESRCPPNIECIWEGGVAVKIQINSETKTNLGIHTTIGDTYQYGNNTIRLLSVAYDKDENYGEDIHYSIRICVE